MEIAPREVGAEDLECVEIGVGPEDVQLAALMIRSICSWSRSPLAPTSEKPAAKDDGELGLRGDRGPAGSAAARRRGSPPGPAAPRCRSGSWRTASPATSVRLGLTKCTVAPRSSAHSVIFWVSVVFGSCIRSPRPPPRPPASAGEGAQVDGAEGGRAAGDVRPVARLRGACCHVPPSCRAALPLGARAVPVQPCSCARPPPVPGAWRAREGPRGHSPYMTPMSVSIRYRS